MKALTKRMLALAGVLALGLTFARAQSDGALLDALVKKGVLSDQEAEDIRADEAKDYATSPAAKFTIGDYVSKITFYGDGRLRYDIDSLHRYADNNGGTSAAGKFPSTGSADRFRYRLRFGLDYNYSDNLKAGFELTSGTADDTANQTLGGSFTDASINVGRIYLQYTPVDWLTLTAGKFANPWYENTDLVWANDLNPEGAAEVFNWTIPLGGGSSAPASTDSKDLKALAPISAPSESSLSVGLTLLQYDYITANQNVPFGGTTATTSPFIQNDNNVGIIGTQIPVVWKINKNLTAKIAPGFTFYTGGGNTDFQGGVPVNYNNVSYGGGPAWVYGTENSSTDPVFLSPKEADDLNIVSAPGEIDFKIGDIPIKVYEDFDWNVTGKQRVQNVFLQTGGTYTLTGSSGTSASYGWGSVPTGGLSNAKVQSQNTALGDNVAWAAGVQVGQNKKKGDWSILGEFRQVGLGAVDSNINGTDFADSYSNAEGVKTSAVYNFTDFMTATVTFYDTWAYKSNLYHDLNGNSDASADNGTTQGLIAQHADQRVQVDLGWKF